MKITRQQLRKLIAESWGDANDPYNPDANTDLVQRDMPTFYRYKPRDPEDVIPDHDRFDHARTQEEFLEEFSQYISSAIAKRLKLRGTRRGVSPADLKRMSFALMREITAEAGDYTGLSLDDFLKLIKKGDLDKKINAMRSDS